jgi:hypothetical protein
MLAAALDVAYLAGQQSGFAEAKQIALGAKASI